MRDHGYELDDAQSEQLGPRFEFRGCHSFQSSIINLQSAWAHFTAARPRYSAASPNSSSIRKSWLYLAMRSMRLAEPVLIWPVCNPTARSAMNASSVSPERCET